MTLDLDEFDALTRLDFWIFVQRAFAELNAEPFLDNFHVQLLAGRLDRVRLGTARRIAVALPPRNLKSVIVSVALPAWLLGHDPATQIICASYGQDLANKLSGDCRQVMQSSWYRRLFPAAQLAASRQAIDRYETRAGGARKATSVGGVLTGFGADVIIVDDPMKPDEAYSEAERVRANSWARHTLFTRLNDKAKGAIILVMQRLHEDDMIGHVQSFTDDFELISFPAIAQADEHHVIETPFGTLTHDRREGEALHPEREPLGVLAVQRRLMGNAFFAAQYLQSPTPPGGGIVKTEWFQRFDAAAPPRFEYTVQSWDTASKASQLSDYSVCTTWGITGTTVSERRAYLLHVARDRMEYPALKKRVAELARLYRPRSILVEDTASGVQLVQELKLAGLPVSPIKPRGDKILRMQAQTAAIEAGRIYVPREAPWLDAYLHELELFPKGRFDDQVDSTSQALGNILTPTGADNAIEYMQQRKRQQELEDIYPDSVQLPSIRLNYPDLGMTFHLITGRVAEREHDGSFLVTLGELTAAMRIPGMIRVE